MGLITRNARAGVRGTRRDAVGAGSPAGTRNPTISSRTDSDPPETTAGEGPHRPARPQSQVPRPQACSLSELRQHSRSDLIGFMEGKGIIRPTRTTQGSMRATFALDCPPDSKQRSQNPPRLRGRPLAHAAATNEMSTISTGVSPCSMRSATTCSAKACTRETASSRVAPYTMTPGRSRTSAIQRPSSSRSSSIVNRISASVENAAVWRTNHLNFSQSPTVRERDRQTPERVRSRAEPLSERSQARPPLYCRAPCSREAQALRRRRQSPRHSSRHQRGVT